MFPVFFTLAVTISRIIKGETSEFFLVPEPMVGGDLVIFQAPETICGESLELF